MRSYASRKGTWMDIPTARPSSADLREERVHVGGEHREIDGVDSLHSIRRRDGLASPPERDPSPSITEGTWREHNRGHARPRAVTPFRLTLRFAGSSCLR